MKDAKSIERSTSHSSYALESSNVGVSDDLGNSGNSLRHIVVKESTLPKSRRRLNNKPDRESTAIFEGLDVH